MEVETIVPVESAPQSQFSLTEENDDSNSIGDDVEVRTRFPETELRDFDTIETFKCFICRSAR